MKKEKDNEKKVIKEPKLKKVKEPKAPKAPKAPKVPKAKEAKAPKVKESKEAREARKALEKQEKSGVNIFNSIRTRLLIAFLVPVVLMMVLSYISYEQAANAVIDNYKASVEQTNDMIQQYVSLIASSEKEQFKTYVNDQDFKNYFANVGTAESHGTLKKQIKDTLKNRRVLDTKISAIVFAANSGDTIAITASATGDDILAQYKATAQGAEVVSRSNDWLILGADSEADGVLGVTGGSYAMRIAKVFSNDAICTVDIDAAVVRNAMQSLDPGDGGCVALITEDGVSFMADETTADLGSWIASSSYYADFMASEAENSTLEIDKDGTAYLLILNKMTIGNACIASLVPQDNLLAGTEGIKQVAVIFTIIAIIIVTVLGTIITRQMFGTIDYIRRQLKKVADGNLTVNLQAKKKDELGALCTSVNNTVAQVKDLIVNVNEVSEQLISSSEQVQQVSDTFVDTSNGIQNAIGEINDGVARVDEGSVDCVSQMDNLSGKIANVSNNAGQIEKLASETGSTIERGLTTVQSLTESAESTAAITQNVIINVEELEKKSRSIESIVSAINDIAEQTNLLSLNASIEAARAGQAGRGFSVVAEEIRKLADQCITSAGQINTIIDEITAKTSQVMDIAREAENVVTAQTDAVTETTESFKLIASNVDGLLAELGSISSNMDEMNVSKNHTIDSIKDIAKVSTATADGTSAVNESIESQLGAVEELREAAGQLEGRAAKLSELLGKFTV